MSERPSIRDRRLARGLSQEVLAQRCGMPQITLSRLERLPPSISVVWAIRVARALGTTVEELFGDQAAGRSSTRGRRRLIPLDELGGAPVAGTGT